MSMRQRQEIQKVLWRPVARQYLFACAASGIHGKIKANLYMENLFK
jgi:hypothetical protein